MALAGLAGMTMFLGGAFEAMGAQRDAEAKAKAARFNAGEADQDASIADANAQLILQQSASDERKVRIMGRRVAGEMKVSFGASGFQSDGNAEDLLRNNAANVEEDVANLKTTAMNQSAAYRFEAGKKRRYADMLRSGADATISAGYLSAAGSLLGAGAKTASMYGG